MYTLKMSPVHSHNLEMIDYEIVDCRLDHLSKKVAKHTNKHTSGLLDFPMLNDSTVCPGCTKGKQPQYPFPPTSICKKHTFELIYMDIKSFPTESYHKYKYLIILDDFTSMAWTILLHVKRATLIATCQFLQIVKMQFQVSIQGWMSDFGREYKSATYDDLLKGEGI